MTATRINRFRIQGTTFISKRHKNNFYDKGKQQASQAAISKQEGRGACSKSTLLSLLHTLLSTFSSFQLYFVAPCLEFHIFLELTPTRQAGRVPMLPTPFTKRYFKISKNLKLHAIKSMMHCMHACNHPTLHNLATS